jgi:hypothetical protein
MEKLNPWLFALLAYVVTAVIAAGVTLIVKIIALVVQRKKGAADAVPKTEG